MELKINQSLDAEVLAQSFAKNQRIQVNNFLEPDCANDIYQCLTQETPWLVGYRDTGKDYLVTEDHLKNMPPQDMQAMMGRVLGQAQNEFQFIYCSYPLMDEGLRRKNPDLYSYNWVDFANSEPLLEFIRTVTGLKSLVGADAQGTWYRRNQFLTLHNDYDPSDDGKRVAYVLSMARNWRPDWGGFLQFYDDNNNIVEGFMPAFNSLSMFETPQNHSVSYVTPFCGDRRVSITGWFRDKEVKR